jgi:tRNA pseudouridine32 synthase/23S rRNA pseudouridine746 synthase
MARAAVNPDLRLPRLLRSRIIKQHGQLQAAEELGEPNAETLIEHLGDGLYRLTPRTGRTHQLRVHMNSLGLPIDNDPFYPDVIEMAPDDFTKPLQLLARSLSFRDPVSGRELEFVSTRNLNDGRTDRCPRRSPLDSGPPPPAALS